MARTALTAQEVSTEGLVATYTDANADGHSFENDGNTILHVKNGSADTECVVTVQTPQTVSGQDVAELEVTVADGDEAFIGRLRPVTFNRPQGATDPGMVYVDFDTVTDVTVALIEP